jgi:hypothetical protein
MRISFAAMGRKVMIVVGVAPCPRATGGPQVVPSVDTVTTY